MIHSATTSKNRQRLLADDFAERASRRAGNGFGIILLFRYDIPMATITWRVEELAARRRWGARQLAEEAGLDQKTVRNILAGRATRVDLETIARLSEALGVAPGALWRVDPEAAEAWGRTAGTAGQAKPAELEEALAGWPQEPDPALERATRSA